MLSFTLGFRDTAQNLNRARKIHGEAFES